METKYVFLLCARFNSDDFGYRVIQAFLFFDSAKQALDISTNRNPYAEMWIESKELE